MRLTAQLSGRLQAMLFSLTHPDFSDLMTACAVVMQEDHAYGVLHGTDGDGNPMERTRYRNSLTTAPPKKRPTLNTMRDGYKPISAGSRPNNNNLTSAEYRKLSGPPLAPRGPQSRVIRNYVTRTGLTSTGSHYVQAAIVDVVSAKGVEFLPAHFDGVGRLPKRDLRGIRPTGLARILRLLELDIRRKFAEG